MNEYNIKVNFEKSMIQTNLKKLVQNDYNTTKLNFTFDKDGRVLFKMLYPDGTQYVDEIQNNELIFGKGVLNQEGTYEYEISLYSEDGRLTDYAVKSFEVRSELVDTDEIVEPDDRVPVLDTLINEVSTIKEDVADGKYNGDDGKDGITPTIGENGNWYIGDTDTGLPSRGETGKAGSVKFIVANELPTENIEEDAIYMIPNSNGIEWDGDITDKETFTYMDFMTFCKVSDQVPTKDELIGNKFTVYGEGEETEFEIKESTTDDEYIVSNLTDDGNVYMVVGLLPTIVVIKEPTTDYPQSAGTYFMTLPDGSGYTSSLSIMASGENTYQEYIYVNGAWESLGVASVEVDLSNYPTKEEMDNAINSASKGFYEYMETENDSLVHNGKTVGFSNVENKTNFLNVVLKATENNTKPGSVMVKDTKYNDITLFNLYQTTKGSTTIYYKVIAFSPSSSTSIDGHFNIYIGDGSVLLNDDFTLKQIRTYLEDTYDLSTLATKEEVKAITGELENLGTGDKSNLVNAINEVIASGNSEIGFYTWTYSGFPTSRNNDLKSSYGTFFQDMVNDAYSKGYKGIMIQKMDTSDGFNGSKPQIAFVDFNYDLQKQPDTFGFSGYAMTSGGADMSSAIYKARIRITGTWENNVFTLNSVYWDGGVIDVLHKKNTIQYTPTSNYHPATKKYVDDAISAAITTVLEGEY